MYVGTLGGLVGVVVVVTVCVCMLVAQLCPSLCDPMDCMDCRLPGFSVHGILPIRILE